MHTLDFAIQTEVERVRYYSEQAQKNQGTTMQKVFEILAEEELEHELILRRILSDTFSEIEENTKLKSMQTIFANLDHFKDEIRDNPHQIDVYRLARDLEQKSIDLYQQMAHEAQNDIEKTVLGYLIRQETHHYQILDEFMVRIGRPEEWVESAEFGEREEY